MDGHIERVTKTTIGHPELQMLEDQLTARFALP
jgi:hypothetical protein